MKWSYLFHLEISLKKRFPSFVYGRGGGSGLTISKVLKFIKNKLGQSRARLSIGMAKNMLAELVYLNNLNY